MTPAVLSKLFHRYLALLILTLIVIHVRADEAPSTSFTDELIKPSYQLEGSETKLEDAENIDLSKPTQIPKIYPQISIEPDDKEQKSKPEASNKVKTTGNATDRSEVSSDLTSEDGQTTPSDKSLPATIQSDIPVATLNNEQTTINTQVSSEDMPLVMLDKRVKRGTTTRLSWMPQSQFGGLSTPSPVLIAHGAEPGPILCLTAAIHGDELIGIEVVRRVLYDVDVEKLAGTIIGVPIVNIQGFMRSSRYLTDRRDLNRYFPGSPSGSSASRIAYSFFKDVITHCDLLVDIHTGSFYRTNLPQLRGNLKDPAVLELTRSFGEIVVLQSDGAKGTLRRAAVEYGIPAVTLEAGGPMALEEQHVQQGVKSINTLLDQLDMIDTYSFWGVPQPAYYKSIWVRADQGGILLSKIKLGQRVRKNQSLGTVTDPITNAGYEILSPVVGRVIGMAFNQVVQPGFAAYHIGIDPMVEKINSESPTSIIDDNSSTDMDEEAGEPGTDSSE